MKTAYDIVHEKTHPTKWGSDSFYNAVTCCESDHSEEDIIGFVERVQQDARADLLERIRRLETALRPLVGISLAWKQNELDESRPDDWGDSEESAAKTEIYTGRGGKTLLTLGQCFDAAKAVL